MNTNFSVDDFSSMCVPATMSGAEVVARADAKGSKRWAVVEELEYPCPDMADCKHVVLRRADCEIPPPVLAGIKEALVRLNAMPGSPPASPTRDMFNGIMRAIAEKEADPAVKTALLQMIEGDRPIEKRPGPRWFLLTFRDGKAVVAGMGAVMEELPAAAEPVEAIEIVPNAARLRNRVTAFLADNGLVGVELTRQHDSVGMQLVKLSREYMRTH